MTHEELLKKREQVLLKLMEDPMYQPMRLREIALFLDVPKSKRRDLEETLDALVREGRIRISKSGKWETAVSKGRIAFSPRHAISSREKESCRQKLPTRVRSKNPIVAGIFLRSPKSRQKLRTYVPFEQSRSKRIRESWNATRRKS